MAKTLLNPDIEALFAAYLGTEEPSGLISQVEELLEGLDEFEGYISGIVLSAREGSWPVPEVDDGSGLDASMVRVSQRFSAMLDRWSKLQALAQALSARTSSSSPNG
ncbi:MAG: hypothetical protein KC561_17495 [Myxococcales bacterium]|nr:hypothetical protein [Myxococcales bacterium]